MMQHRRISDKTVQAVSLIEEACLAVLMEHLALGDGRQGLSAEEIAKRIGLDTLLGPGVSNAVVENVLFNLMASQRAEPVPEALARARWKVTEIEASIRPMPVISTSTPSQTT